MSSERQRLATILGRAPRVRVITYDKDARPLATSHKAVTRGEFVFIRVARSNALIERIAHDKAARIGQATARGRAVGGNVVATCSVVGGGIDEIVDELMRWKYGWTVRFDGPGPKRNRKVIVQITLDPRPDEHDDSPALQD